MKNRKLVRSAVFMLTLLLGGAGMAGTAFAYYPSPRIVITIPWRSNLPKKGCQWNNINFKDGDSTTSTVHHADGTITTVTYKCSDGEWIA